MITVVYMIVISVITIEHSYFFIYHHCAKLSISDYDSCERIWESYLHLIYHYI